MPDLQKREPIFEREVREAMSHPGPHAGQARAFLEPNDMSGETSDGGRNPAVARLRQMASKVELNESGRSPVKLPDVSDFRFGRGSRV
jgi:hypothetical protein